MELYKIPNLVVGTIVKRPSQHCKTPYVADVRLEDGTMVMAHTAALGCSGLADAGGVVIMQPVENKKNVCSHKILMVKQTERNTERILGIDPKMAETLAEECLKNNCIRHLEDVVSYKREQKRLKLAASPRCVVHPPTLPQYYNATRPPQTPARLNEKRCKTFFHFQFPHS